jgi:hypothetical protein
MKSKEEKETKKERKLQKLQTRKVMMIPAGAGIKRVSDLGHTRLDCYLTPVLIPVLISVSDLIYQINTNISTYIFF